MFWYLTQKVKPGKNVKKRFIKSRNLKISKYFQRNHADKCEKYKRKNLLDIGRR